MIARACILGLTAFAATALGGEKKPVSPLDFELETAAGESRKPAATKGAVTVLEWARPDCPCTIDYYKTQPLAALQSEMRSRSVKWMVILPVLADLDTKGREKLVELLNDAGAKPDEFLFDPGFKLTDALELEILPHVIVIDEFGKTAYSGAIDTECKPVAEKELLKKKKEILPQSEKRDYLRDNLNNLLSGNPVAEKETKTKGCLIRRFKLVPAQKD